MKFGKVCLTFIFIVSTMFIFSSCKSSEKSEDYILKFSGVSLFSNQQDEIDAYSISEDNIRRIGVLNNVSSLNYNLKNSIYVFLKTISNNESMQHNKIIIFKQEKEITLSNFYTALDIKMCSSGEKIAFRNFKSGDIKSVQPLKIYNTEKEKYEKFNSKVFISGNLYQWIDSNSLVYYGSKDGIHDKIYLYDFSNGQEKVLADGIQGYVTFFQAIKNKGILFLQEEEDSTKLYYLDYASNERKVIASQISDVSSSIVLSNSQIFFIGNNTDENKDLLYKFNISDRNLTRINFDFPDRIEKNSSLAGNGDKVYFCGFDSGNNVNLYMFDNSNGALNYMSNNNGKLVQQNK